GILQRLEAFVASPIGYGGSDVGIALMRPLFIDKHNMVAFLKKPNESVGFTEIVDFLKGTSLRYALTHNPTIYDSLVKQFWQTATVRTLANRTPELVASIDNKEYTITEASVRSKLQLADAAGISNLPDAEIYDGLATLGYVSEGKLTFWKKNFTPQWKFLIHTILHCLSPKSGGWDQFGSPIATALICLSSNRVYNFSKLIFDGMVHNIESNTKFLMYPRFLQMILGITTENNGKYLAPTLTKKLFANMKRGYAGDYVPLLPAMLAGAAEDQGEGSAIPAEPQHTPTDPGPTFTHVADEATTTGVRVGTEGATTTTSGLDAGLDSGNIHESPLRSHEAPLHEGHTSGSAEDSLQLKELMVLVPKLVTRIANLEKELHQTKTTYGKAVLTLVERVKSLEVALKRKTKKVVVSDSEDEETENQGRKIQDIDDDPLVSLVRESMKEKDTDFMTLTKISASGEVQEQDISPITLEAAKTLSHVISQKAKSIDKGIRYKRKTRSKSTEKDISTDLDTGIEVNPGSEDFNIGNEDFNTGSLGVSTGSGPVSTPKKDWDTIRAKLEANAELTKSLQGESMTSKDFAKRMVEMINQKKKFYAEQKAKARRSKPMIQAQQRDYMSTFIKNQSSWKLTQLKKLTFDELKTEFEKLVKSIKNFVPMEMMKGSKVTRCLAGAGRGGIRIFKDSKGPLGVSVLEEKVLQASELLLIWKIIPPGLKVVYQIIRRDGSDKIYMSFGAILKDFSRDDLTELYRLVIKKYGVNRPEEIYDRVLWGDLKTMFDPPLSDDAIWSLPLQQKMIN
ncbi:hypothetical protein Tco_0925818, partial [Tanacetum coccineum]